ncbi:MAG: amidohydrolase family protein, partial [Dehalococcoidia bacterium]
MDRDRVIAVARGEAAGDLLLAGGRIVNVFSGEVEEGDVVIAKGVIAGIGPGYRAAETVALDGAYLLPGFINGHTHVESSFLSPSQYARAVLPHGTTSVVTDLHELANVGGLQAIRNFLDEAAALPLDVFLMAPSCVPATHLETAGAALDAQDVAVALAWPETLGLGELMNFPGAIAGQAGCLDKVAAARDRGKVVD